MRAFRAVITGLLAGMLLVGMIAGWIALMLNGVWPQDQTASDER